MEVVVVETKKLFILAQEDNEEHITEIYIQYNYLQVDPPLW